MDGMEAQLENITTQPSGTKNGACRLCQFPDFK